MPFFLSKTDFTSYLWYAEIYFRLGVERVHSWSPIIKQPSADWKTVIERRSPVLRQLLLVSAPLAASWIWVCCVGKTSQGKQSCSSQKTPTSFCPHPAVTQNLPRFLRYWRDLMPRKHQEGQTQLKRRVTRIPKIVKLLATMYKGFCHLETASPLLCF